MLKKLAFWSAAPAVQAKPDIETGAVVVVQAERVQEDPEIVVLDETDADHDAVDAATMRSEDEFVALSKKIAVQPAAYAAVEHAVDAEAETEQPLEQDIADAQPQPICDESSEGDELFECPVCLEEIEDESLLFVCRENAHHRFCRGCVVQYVSSAVAEGSTELSCPAYKCGMQLPAPLVTELLHDNPDLMMRFRSLSLLRANPNARACPRCNEVKVGSAAEPDMVCDGCGNDFCFEHAGAHSGIPCAEYQPAETTISRIRSAWYKWRYTKPCPGCGVAIWKNGGCNNMTCSRCKQTFCWVCLAKRHGCSHPHRKMKWVLYTFPISVPLGLAAGAVALVLAIPYGIGLGSVRLFQHVRDAYHERQMEKRRAAALITHGADVLDFANLSGFGRVNGRYIDDTYVAALHGRA